MSLEAPKNRLLLRGPLTVAASESIHAEFGAALKRGGEIVVETDPDPEADIAFLQLLIAAERSAASLGVRVALHAPPAGGLAAALKSCGFRPGAGATALKDIFSAIPGRQP